MKKFLAIILALLTLTLTFTGCEFLTGNDNSQDENTLTFYCPDGAPSLAMAKFMQTGTVKGYDIESTVVSANDITTHVMASSTEPADIAVLPVNAAAKLCGKGDRYVMVGTITQGNLYIVSMEELSLNDLVGKVVGVIGEGLVPDLTLKAVLSANGIEYETSADPIDGKVALTYKGSGEELMPAMKQHANTGITVGLLPEPAATKIVTKLNTNFTYKMDLGALYDSVSGGYPQAVMVVKKELADDAEFMTALETQVNDSITWATNPDNAESAVTTAVSFNKEGVVTSLDSFVTADVISRFGIKYTSAKEHYQSVKTYLTRINVALPNDAFFYGI